MAEFVAFDPNVEVLGAALQSFFDAAGHNIQPILDKYGLTEVDPQEWYPQQWVLELYQEVARHESSSLNLVSIGMRIPEVAAFPPDLDSLEAALMMLDAAYHMNHRGGDTGYYRATPIGPKHFSVECRNPYPSDFDYGIIYAVVKRFKPAGTAFVVQRDEEGPSRQKGDDYCTFDVTWE
jgi:hypothetical protein